MTKEFQYVLLGVLGILVVSSIIGWILHRKFKGSENYKTIKNLNDRIKSWWIMAVVFSFTLYLGKYATTALFFCISFLALREFITLIPTKKSDHRALFWTFFIILPIQYLLVGIHWYGLFTIFIPVYAFILIPIRKVLAGETKDYLASTSRIQWGLLVCVYFVSHMPLILDIPIKNWEGNNAVLLFFFVLTAQLSDVMQYTWGKLCGKHPIVPKLSPNKTWEGFIGGILTTTLISTALYWVTPFAPWQAALMALMICLLGFTGGLVMSAIKRDLGAKDWGSSIAGHGGFMDRIDSLCFAAPLFFHLTGFFFGTGVDPTPPEWIYSFR